MQHPSVRWSVKAKSLVLFARRHVVSGTRCDEQNARFSNDDIFVCFKMKKVTRTYGAIEIFSGSVGVGPPLRRSSETDCERIKRLL